MSTPAKSFYKRPLPDDLLPFSSPAGKSLFKSALLQGNLEGYFPLAEQFLTQNRPDHCAKSTLVMALNTLQIDPGRVWIKPWRWFSEEGLACLTEKSGLSIHEFVMVGLCNGVWQQGFYPLGQKERDGRAVIPRCCEQQETRCCHSDLPGTDTTPSQCSTCSSSPLADCCNPNSNQLHLKYSSLSTFRAAIKSSLRREGFLVLLNHSRKALNQTGDGHYSPIAGYEEDSDMALVMDVARFKYPAFWCSVEKLYHSLELCDTESGKMRGFLVAGRPKSGNFEREMTVDVLSISRIQGKLVLPGLFTAPPVDLYPILLYHFVTLSELLIPDEVYARFLRETESLAVFAQAKRQEMSDDMGSFLEEITEELKVHYVAVMLTAVGRGEGETGELFGVFVRTLRIQLGLEAARVA